MGVPEHLIILQRNHVLVYCEQEATTVRSDFGETEGFRINKG